MTPIADKAERQEALNPSRSFIVQAPAGSGKTELLIQRYLKLLSRVNFPEEILCMTFTRKAAGEMRTRILKALERARDETAPEEPHQRETWELASEVLAQDKHRGWNLLDYNSRLKVQTIDSFCTWLVCHMPLKSRLGGRAEPDENSHGVYMETARRLLKLAESDGPDSDRVRIILKHLDNNKGDFLKRIVQLLEKRDQWFIPFFQNNQLDGNLRSLLESSLQEIISGVLQETANVFPDNLKEETLRLVNYSESHRLKGDNEGPFPLADMTSFPAGNVDNLDIWRGLIDFFLTTNGEFRSKVDKRHGFPPGEGEAKEHKLAFKELVTRLGDQKGIESRLQEIRLLPDPHYSDPDWNILVASVELFGTLDRILRTVFREQEITDFTEISLSAIRSLGSEDEDGNLLPTDLALYLDYKIQHILVDEFQDTSFKQHELLKRLTAGWEPNDGKTLFIVGDPMQSIFRFRDADVGLFLKSRILGVGDVPLEGLTLTTNFRSTQNIVEWVNQCFQKVFPSQENPDLGEIQFTPSTAFHPAIQESEVVLHPVSSIEENSEAHQVAHLAQEIMTREPEKSIAILVRAKRHLLEITQTLRDLGLDYKAQDIDPLTQRWEILDLLSLLRALRNPLDRIAWLSILRAPWCGLKLTDLHALCLNEGRKAVWDLLQEDQTLARLEEEAKSRVLKFRELMAPALAAMPRTHFRDLLEGLWIALGGPACIPSSSMQDVEVFFEEVERVVQTGALKRFDHFEKELEKLFASPTPKETNLHILTMHKAKGLEFDYVLLPGLGRRPRSEAHRLVFWLPHGESILLAPIQETGVDPSPLYNFIKGLDGKKDEYEAMRLLYVAATRARHQLHLFGHVKQGKDTISPEGNSPLHMLWPWIEKEWIAKTKADDREHNEAGPATYPLQLQRLPTNFQLPESPPSLDTGRTYFLREPEVATYDWAQYTARCIGTVVHRCLQTLSQLSLEELDDSTWDLWEHRLRLALASMGLTGKELSRACVSSLEALRNTVSDPTGRWVLAARNEAHSEWAITLREKDEIQQRIIDRTFVDQGVRWIIDYKTSIHSGASLDEFLENEKQRHAPQLNAYERIIMHLGENRPIKKALYFPIYQKLMII